MKTRPSVRLGVEPLEDRVVPANFGLLASGPSKFSDALTGLQAKLTDELFGAGLPLAGDAMTRTDSPGRFAERFDDAARTFEDRLGPNPTASEVKQALVHSSLPVLGHSTSFIDVVDPDGTVIDNDAEAEQAFDVQFRFVLTKTTTFNSPFQIGGSLNGLKLTAPDATVPVTFTYTVPVTLGVDAGGVYLDFSADVDAAVAAPTFMSAVDLGFLNLTASDRGDTGVTANYRVLIDAGRVRPGEVAGLAAASRLDLDAKAHLRFESGVTTAVVSPRFRGDLDVAWAFSDQDAERSPGTLGPAAPTATLSLELDAESIATGVLGPYLNFVNRTVAPLRPIVDKLLSQPVPNIDLSYIDYLELAFAFDGGTLAGIDKVLEKLRGPESDLKAFQRIADLLDEITARTNKYNDSKDGNIVYRYYDGFGDQKWIPLGVFKLGDLRTASAFSTVTADGTKIDVLENLRENQPTRRIAELLAPPAADTAAARVAKLDFPSLTEPVQAARLFLGDPSARIADFGFNLPSQARPKAGGHLYEFSTLLGPLPVNFTADGTLSASAALTFGFDGYGFNEAATARADGKSAAEQAAALFDGFYLDGNPSSTFLALNAGLSITAGVGGTFSIAGLVRDYLGVKLPPAVAKVLNSITPEILLRLYGETSFGINVGLTLNTANVSDIDDNPNRLRFSEVEQVGLGCLLKLDGKATFEAGINLEYGVTIHTFFHPFSYGPQTKDVLGPFTRTVSFTSPPCPPVKVGLQSQRAGAAPVTPHAREAVQIDGASAQPAVSDSDPNASSYQVREGQQVVLSGRTSTPAGQDQPTAGSLTYRWLRLATDGRNPAAVDVLSESADGADLTFIPRRHTDDTTDLLFELTVEDQTTGYVDVQRVRFQVANAPPVATAIGPVGAVVPVCGVPNEFGVDFTDPGSADPFAADWAVTGPGGEVTLTGPSGVAGPVQLPAALAVGEGGAVSTAGRSTATYTFADAGSYTYAATVRDGGPADPGSARSAAVEVAAAGLYPDQDDPSLTSLYVGGTPAGETITLSRDPNTGKVVVKMPGYTGRFPPRPAASTCSPGAGTTRFGSTSRTGCSCPPGWTGCRRRSTAATGPTRSRRTGRTSGSRRSGSASPFRSPIRRPSWTRS